MHPVEGGGECNSQMWLAEKKEGASGRLGEGASSTPKYCSLRKKRGRGGDWERGRVQLANVAP